MPNLTIKLLGSLGRRYGQTHRLKAARLSEGLSFLRYQCDGFERSILDLDRQGIRFSLIVQTPTTNTLIDDPTGLHLAITQDATLIIAPVPAAAGDVGKFVVGVGLLGVAAFFPGSIGVLGLAAPISTATLGLYGAGMVLGTVINWLSPKTESKSSTISPTISNNRQGNPIPIGYGRRFVTPQVISGGTQIIDLTSGVDARSAAQLQVVDALCEGKIKGLTNGERSIWLNGVPIRNADNSLAYQGITGLTYVYGNQNDPALAAPWDKVLAETTVNQKLTQLIGPVTRRINNNQANNIGAIKIRLYWDRAIFIGDGEFPVHVSHQISIKEGTGAWQVRHVDSIYVKAASSFEREIELSVNQAPYYEMKVERLTIDEAPTSTLYSVAYWKTYTSVLNAKLRYPSTVKVGLNINLEQFGATDLQRVYQLDLLEILIPDNATVRADGSLSYSGLWSGTFQRAWSSDPAWCLYDLLTNDRYGCRVDATHLDKYAFYACSAYCAELVPDGYGGTEPRFNLNAIITNRDSAYNLIQKLASVFNAIAYYEAGNLIPVVDRPLPVNHQFTNANATFNYSGTAYRNRRNRAVVQYTRPEVPDSTDYEIYEDKADILKRGVEEVQIDATDTCTSRGQAHRIGKWTIYSEQSQKESITIQTGMDGALVRPGDIIQVGDRDRAGLRRWGRITAATVNTITIDSPVNLPSGTYTITCTLPDATLVTRTISSISGSTITIAPDFGTIPNPQASWLIAGADLQPTLYRVISRAEPETHRFEILALLHEPSKYDAIEQGLNLAEPLRAVTIPSPPLPPQNLTLTPIVGVGVSIDADWAAPTPDTYTVGYQIAYGSSGAANTVATTTATDYSIGSVTYGEYEVRVRAIDSTGAYSGWLTAFISIDVDAYFATCFLGEFADAWFASGLNPVVENMAVTNLGSTTQIELAPQTNFGSTNHVVLLN